MVGKPGVLVVDEEPLARQGLRQLIVADSGFEIVDERSQCDDLLQAVTRLAPSIVIIELVFSTGLAFNIIRDLASAHPNVAIFVLTRLDGADYARHSLRAGARGYASKQDDPRSIAIGLRQLAAGRVYVSNRIAGEALVRISGGIVELLSECELDVFHRIGLGQTTSEIAAALHRSPKTIETHRQHAKTKLGITSGALLVRAAVRFADQSSAKTSSIAGGQPAAAEETAAFIGGAPAWATECLPTALGAGVRPGRPVISAAATATRLCPGAPVSRHVLVIEEDAATREPLAKLLEYRGHRVSRAVDGEEALAIISGKDPPEVILTDLILPRLDGVELLEQLRRDVVGGQDIPVIVLTATVSDRYLSRAHVLAQHTLLKASFDCETLFSLVDGTRAVPAAQ